ncbi:hypothetical protein ElyMa_003034100 [Elysia marginata]|uniref:SRCR domain-containing protein n=1 Tax=Elysia marginata TaxID=1093978 RepID=A0AAV4IKC3_9GAST|nr:hypothetical protein ElyMa_003034100 [Elysia marginata]
MQGLCIAPNDLLLCEDIFGCLACGGRLGVGPECRANGLLLDEERAIEEPSARACQGRLRGLTAQISVKYVCGPGSLDNGPLRLGLSLSPKALQLHVCSALVVL